MYYDPEVFDPERFLRDGKLNPDVRDPSAYVFGFGRRYVGCRRRPEYDASLREPVTRLFRICPGKHLADAALFIACASILHTFTIRPPVDKDGIPQKLDVNMGNDLAVS